MNINKYMFSSWYKSMPIWKHKTRDITKAELGVTILFLPHICIPMEELLAIADRMITTYN